MTTFPTDPDAYLPAPDDASLRAVYGTDTSTGKASWLFVAPSGGGTPQIGLRYDPATGSILVRGYGPDGGFHAHRSAADPHALELTPTED